MVYWACVSYFVYAFSADALFFAVTEVGYYSLVWAALTAHGVATVFAVVFPTKYIEMLRTQKTIGQVYVFRPFRDLESLFPQNKLIKGVSREFKLNHFI